MRQSRNVFVVAAVIVVLALIGLGIYQWRTTSETELPSADGPRETTSEVAAPAEPDWCPAVEVISVPGTWESSRDDDPFNPQANPASFMLSITRPLQEMYDINHVRVFTVPYTAQFHNPLSADRQMSYNDSRAEGTRAAVEAMTDMNNRCPLTSYVLIGFSQGAVIAGDIASDIGNGRGPVDQDLVLGVTLIADGRRQDGVGQDVGPNPPGQGAEITLHEVPTLSALGLSMTGPRPGGFGALNDRTNEICARGDLICAAPESAFNITQLPQTLQVLSGGAGQPVHAMYATPDFWNLDGLPATGWTLNWAQSLVSNAPQPKHG